MNEKGNVWGNERGDSCIYFQSLSFICLLAGTVRVEISAMRDIPMLFTCVDVV